MLIDREQHIRHGKTPVRRPIPEVQPHSPLPTAEQEAPPSGCNACSQKGPQEDAVHVLRAGMPQQ